MNNLKREYKSNYKTIKKYYDYLSDYSIHNTHVGLVNEWILDNYYLLIKRQKWINQSLNNKDFIKRYNNSVYELIKRILEKDNYKVNTYNLYKTLSDYQEETGIIFSYIELQFIPELIYLALVERLSEIATFEFKTLKSIETSHRFINKLDDNFNMKKYFEKNKALINDYRFIENVYNDLTELGSKCDIYLKKFTVLLKNNGIDLRKALEISYLDVADNTVVVSNVFNSIISFDIVNTMDVFLNTNKAEKLLLNDKYYKLSDINTKDIYRKRITKEAKKLNISEYEYVKSFYDNNSYHIGFMLFKKQDNRLKAILYISFISITTIILSLLLGNYLFKPFYISFLLLLIPISEIITQIINKLLLKFSTRKRIFKLSFDSGIPEEYKTMVLITTIVNTKEKVLQMFENLEEYYILNKSENLYFTLLGDAKGEKTKDTKYDNEISEIGSSEVKRLNKKYGKDIFGFIYRNRFYNDSEECYLGYERKRGAIEQLNSLLLNEFSEEEKNKWFRNVILSKKTKDIKYVITLDVDTNLSLGNASKLVGAMAHPLNTPVLNKEETRVIEGYGIIQPKVSVDINSSNKSVFTQIMAGLGGFDIYNNVVPELYHDVFNSASYCGKGIYDIKVFNKVLSKKLPENLILSHDLLESCFTRCGYASDIELIDDYPSSFLVDAKRRHRWARGDMQIFSYIFNKNITAINKWKIFDNIRRGLLDASLLLVLTVSYVVTTINPIYWLLFVIGVILLPIIFYILDKLKIQKNRSTRLKQYKNIIIGLKSVCIRTFLAFSAIPYNAKLYIDAFIRSIYRMLISKKHLLAWVTAEDSASGTKGGIIDYFWNFKSNLIIVSLFIIIDLILKDNNIFSVMVICLVFLTSPVTHYFVSCDIPKKQVILSNKKNSDITKLALETWKYFEEYLTKENNYLIPDNYQEKRFIKCDYRTSPTNIGMSIMSVISACELKFISYEKAIEYIEKIITTVNKLEKYRGHLYNWYNINTLDVIAPLIISTVDSGNFIASLMIAKGFISKNENTKLNNEIETLIKEANFNFLYFEKSSTFSIGYDVQGSGLLNNKYDTFASEARITSYVAISKGDIPYKNWFSLDKTLTKFYNYKGLLSWNGTSFEYFMPLIFLKTYDNTLIDESYYFSVLCQKLYSKAIDLNLPWGISESAYDELDDSRNYKYYAFGTPNLKIRESKDERIVIAPYASILAIEKYANDVYDNLIKYKRLNMYGRYGLYESYDHNNKTPVYAYFAHHQGMILSSITNYLTDNKLKEYLYSDIRVRAFDILNKEKAQINPMIDTGLYDFIKIDYKKESFKNSIRTYNKLCERPEVSVLSNSKYSILINDRGNGFSRFNAIQLNRYRKISEQDYGTFLYIKDLSNNKVWSNTYSPVNKKPDTYEVTYALDKVKYYRRDDDIVTLTEIIVTAKDNAEIRKVTFINNTSNNKELEVTSYVEPIISENGDDIGHRVFNNMFITSSYDKKSSSLIFERKNRNNEEKNYMLHRLITHPKFKNYSYETFRNNFISRNEEYSNPSGLYKKLTNTVGDVLDPVGCIRNRIKIPAGSKETVYIINGFGRSFEQIEDIISEYNTKSQIKDAFNKVPIMTNREVVKLMVEEEDISNYNKALNYLYQTTRISISKERMDLLRHNNLSQKDLWKFSVSGDLPIILFEIEDVKSLGLCKEVLKMFEYYKSIGIYVELVIINSSNDEYRNLIKKEIDNTTYKMYLINDFNNTPGKIEVLDKKEINDEELNLFRSIARLWINSKTTSSFSDFIEKLQNEKEDYYGIQSRKLQSNEIVLKKEEYNNTFGGFINNGKEYLINTPNTPMPWVNVLSNGTFGSIVSNNYNGFTFYKNSNEFKITSWNNETILDDKSEGISINNEDICFNTSIFGFGYAKYKFENNDYKIDMDVHIPKKDNVKILILNIKNNKDSSNNVKLSYWINPVLGTNEDKTARHIVSNISKENNALYLENGYSMYFKNHIVYLSSSEKIDNIVDTVIKKIININVLLKPNENKKIVFMLGCDEDINVVNKCINKYQNVDDSINSFNKTILQWEKDLGIINVDTPDNSFNYMINGWLSYQSIASRIYSRAGFYQVSGAFGFRDQLQDACNMAILNKDLLRKQILLCAKHQFIEGDVLHWWHNENSFGLRSRYKDDYLWLIYATYKYLDITHDYDILKEEIPFVEGDNLSIYENEKGLVYTYSKDTKSLYEHLKITANKAMHEIASNGLPLIGGGDWNDGMNKIGIYGKGSSIWLAFFMYDVMNKYIEINNYLKNDVSKEIKFISNLKNAIKKYGYDKEYYLRAYFDNGSKLGSHSNEECKIDLISQAFAVITGIATKEEQELIDKNVDKYLVDKENKMIKLLTPPFKNTKPNPGYIMNYPQGIRENGGQYTHACAWYIIALINMNKFDKAYEYFQMLNPINHTLTKRDVLKYKVEPYVISADIYSNDNYIGQGGWTWYTGSAGWFYTTAIEGILGIKKHGDILEIKPHVPSDWNNYRISYNYNNTIYNIELIRKDKYEITLDNKKVKEIKLIDDKKTHNIVIEFGGKYD